MYNSDSGPASGGPPGSTGFDDALHDRYASSSLGGGSLVEEHAQWGKMGYRVRMPRELFGDGMVRQEPLRMGMLLTARDFVTREDICGHFEVQHSPIQFGGLVSGQTEFMCGHAFKGSGLGMFEPLELVFKADMLSGRVRVPGGVRLQLVGVELTEDRLERMLSGHPEYEGLSGRVAAMGSGFHVLGRWSLSPSFRILAAQVLNCSLTGLNRKLFMESKALEIIALQLDRLTRGEGGAVPLTRSDVERLHEARRILFERMEEPPGIKALSSLVGINEFKLKRGFREVFGDSVYGTLRCHRMEVARSLLADGDMTVGEAATSVGYTNMSHFIVAFRKQYGITPGALARQTRRSYHRA